MVELNYSVLLVAAIPHSSHFRLSSCSQPQSSAWVCPLKPEFQHSGPVCTSWRCLRLGSAGRWHGPSALVSLCSACCKLASPLSSCTSEAHFQSQLFSQLSLPAVKEEMREYFLFHSSVSETYLQFWSPTSFLSHPTQLYGVQFSSVIESCDLCDHLWPHGLQHARLPCPSPSPGVTQTHVHWVGDAIQPSHPLWPSSPPVFNLSQHQGLFQWVCSLHQVSNVLEFQCQHQSIHWTFRADFL